MASTLEPSPESQKKPTLLTIPIEIRLQIYQHVLHTHPITHAHLAPPSAAQAEFPTTMLRPQCLSYPSTISNPKTRSRNTLPTYAYSKLPTALLVSCRQIKAECRTLPFNSPTFTFVNWFESGVYAARQFSRALWPWQVEEVKFVAVEVLGRDLWIGGMKGLGGGIGVAGKGKEEWRELCILWRGVRRLRLKMKGSVRERGYSWMQGLGQTGWTGEAKYPSPQTNRQGSNERGLLDTKLEWIVDGLAKMRSLRWIELEIEDEDMERDIKITFCAELETALTKGKTRDDGWMDDVRVVFVEPMPEVVVKEEETWYTSEPSDNEEWMYSNIFN